jgi:acetyl esterase/lipase
MKKPWQWPMELGSRWRPRGGRAVSARHFKEFRPQRLAVEGCSVLTITPVGVDLVAPLSHVVFLHGGAYVMEAALPHQLFMIFLARAGFRVSFLDYPLAPEHQALETVSRTLAAYRELTSYYDDSWNLFGDSAGGGLAVVLAQQLRDQQVRPRPVKVALASPWVDLSLSNPLLDGRDDLLLSRDTLRRDGQLYAGDLPLDAPLVSPIYGDLNDLGDLFIAYSESELLQPDCAAFADQAVAAGNSVTRFTTPNLFHDFLLAPGVPAARAGRAALIRFLCHSAADVDESQSQH